jgi:hypothetical protein
MGPGVKTHACEPRIDIHKRPIQVIEGRLVRKDDVITAVPMPPLHVRETKPCVAADVDNHQRDEYDQKALHEWQTIDMVSLSNEKENGACGKRCDIDGQAEGRVSGSE